MSDIRNTFVIGDDNWEAAATFVIDGVSMRRGLIERDYSKIPQGFYASAPPWSLDDMPTIDMDEWPERIRDKEAQKSRISDIYARGNGGQRIPSLDQNGQGYCWAYSPTTSLQALRAICNMPYVPLSAHSVACIIKSFRDEGGWGCLALDFIKDRGVQPQTLWPAKAMSRSYDTPENWQKALEFRVTEGWVDLQPAVYDRDMSRLQVGSALLYNTPVIGDFNWWRHSVSIFDLVDVYPNRSARDFSRYGTRIKNSWRDAWGDHGEAVLKDSKAWPDGGAAPRTPWGG